MPEQRNESSAASPCPENDPLCNGEMVTPPSDPGYSYPCPARSAGQGREWLIRRSWTRLWWCAINPNEALATMDTHTVRRAWTKERLIAKLAKPPKPDPWEEIRV